MPMAALLRDSCLFLCLVYSTAEQEKPHATDGIATPKTPEASLDHSVYYIPDAKVMLCILPKSGSTSFFQWLYNASTGGQSWTDCPTRRAARNIHPSNVLSTCWKNLVGQRQHTLKIKRFRDLAADQKHEAVSSDDVFRFSLVRDPVSRAISGWKSKLACDCNVHVGILTVFACVWVTLNTCVTAFFFELFLYNI
eukprot:m.164092 g.164092  ORF g.164092 m.164092 type:complete len:195 (+) comp18111_c0_seq48:376-960(+)